jgi:hypothetical protein
VTPLDGRYAIYGKLLFKLDLTANAPYLIDVNKTEASVSAQIVFNIDVDGKKKQIPLTKFTYNNQTSTGRWVHTDPKYFEEFKIYIAKLYGEILEMDSDNLEELSFAIGKFHWCMSNLTEFGRGSGAIADQFTKFFWLHHLYRVSPWHEGCSPDCNALSTPNPDEYARNYLSLMERPPIKDKHVAQSSINEKAELLMNLADQYGLVQLKSRLPKIIATHLHQQQILTAARMLEKQILPNAADHASRS